MSAATTAIQMPASSAFWMGGNCRISSMSGILCLHSYHEHTPEGFYNFDRRSIEFTERSAGDDLLRCSDGTLPVCQVEDAINGLQERIDIMGDQQDSNVACPADTFDQAYHLLLMRDIQAGEWFIKQEDAGISEQSL